jgi:hypothetical protein
MRGLSEIHRKYARHTTHLRSPWPTNLPRFLMPSPLTAEQGREIRRLTEVLTRTKAQLADILALAGELRKDTIDRVLTKSDLELGLEALRRHSKPEP